MIGWSYVLLAAAFFLLAPGCVMLAVSLTVQTRLNSMSDYYGVPTTILGASLIGAAIFFVILAYFKYRWHGHV